MSPRQSVFSGQVLRRINDLLIKEAGSIRQHFSLGILQYSFLGCGAGLLLVFGACGESPSARAVAGVVAARDSSNGGSTRESRVDGRVNDGRVNDDRGAVAEEQRLAPFEAVAIDGRVVSVAASPKGRWTVVCFLGNDCPLVKLYAHKLNQLEAEYAGREVQWVAINSNRQDSVEQMQEFVRTHELKLPLVADPFHRLADLFAAQRTPEVFVLDHELCVRYRGRIDDQYQPGVVRQAAQREDLKLALEDLLAGRPVAVPTTNAVGCLIGRVRDGGAEAAAADQTNLRAPNFAEHIAPVVYRHCAECHRPNDIAPFALLDYEDVRGWGEMMVEVIDQGLMPPWHANPAYGKFSNHREMPESDKQLIRDWVAAGTPLGDPERLPPRPEAAGEWLLPRDPDLVVAMGSQPFHVPSQGTVDYKYFVVDPGLKEDVWVQATQVIPGNRGVVHHTIVFVKAPEGEEGPAQGWLAAYVPGQRPMPYPAGYARKISAGSKFIFQQHYTPNGIPQADTTRLGLVFADPATITHRVDTLIALNQDFEIPPHAEDFPVSGSLKQVPQQAAILGLSPHMHYRGKAIQLTAIPLDATTESRILLDVPSYDFNWQHVYAFAEPLPLAGIARIDFDAAFDNSADNPANPNPNDTVMWGDQSWEEMAIIYFDVAWRLPAAAETSPDGEVVGGEGSGQAVSVDAAAVELTPSELALVEEQVQGFLTRFAGAGRQEVPRSALPEAIRRFGNPDQNGDGVVSRDELFEAFRARQLRLRRSSRR